MQRDTKRGGAFLVRAPPFSNEMKKVPNDFSY
jgi:hypothetical protein